MPQAGEPIDTRTNSVVVSHPMGNANLRAVLRAMAGRSALNTFWTSLALPRQLLSTPLLTQNRRRRFGQRIYTEVPPERIRVRSHREIVRLCSGVVGIRSLVQHEKGWASVDQVYWHLDREVSHYLRSPGANNVRAVYAYEDGALESFRAARQIGARCVYDLPIAHWRTLRRLLEEEAELHPAWAATIDGLSDSAFKCGRKDEEIALADCITVASTFTKRSLEEHFGADLTVAVTPYGVPQPRVAKPSERHMGEPLQLFFAGHLNQRKGLAYLIEALMRFDRPWRLTLAGPRPVCSPPELDRFLEDPRCNWLGVIPHTSLIEAMAQAHVFIFPSIVEGFGLVIGEAMSAGLVVITTPHTGGPDFLTDGQDGFVIPIRNADAIAETLTLLFEDELLRRSIASAALDTAMRSSWALYEAAIASVVENQLGAS